jgi:hypothetical protein
MITMTANSIIFGWPVVAATLILGMIFSVLVEWDRHRDARAARLRAAENQGQLVDMLGKIHDVLSDSFTQQEETGGTTSQIYDVLEQTGDTLTRIRDAVEKED